MPYAENRGVKIYYDCYGSGTPIVFLHPWTTNGNIWYYQAFSFAVTNRCIPIDHRGMGRSDKPAAATRFPSMPATWPPCSTRSRSTRRSWSATRSEG